MITPLTPEKQSIVVRLMPRVQAMTNVLARNDEDARQEGMHALVRAIAVWDSDGRAKTDQKLDEFAVQCARFAVLRHRRKRWKGVELDAAKVPDNRGLPVDPFQLIEKLPMCDKKIFLMRFAKGYTIVSISKQMGKKVRFVCASLARSIDRLFELLHEC